MQCYTLQNHLSIPAIGFGTWRVEDSPQGEAVIRDALDAGYRHIDTAASYGNEKSVGRAVKSSGLAREDVFLTSKLANPARRTYDTAVAAFEQTLRALDTDYLDLYLIHWPASHHQFEEWEQINAETWRAFEDLYAQGRVKAIGVSNFFSHHLDALMKTAKITPMVNQVEYHPGWMQPDVVRRSGELGMLVEAWRPLGAGKLLQEPVLADMAARYGKTTAQLCLCWCLQNGTLPLVKTTGKARMAENLAMFDFEIAPADMDALNALPQMAWSGEHPDEIDF